MIIESENLKDLIYIKSLIQHTLDLNKSIDDMQNLYTAPQAKELFIANTLVDNTDIQQKLISGSVNYLKKQIKKGHKRFKIWIIELENLLPKQEDEIQHIESLNANAREKIVALEKLGIIDYLRGNNDFITSTSKMAKFISFITGEKYSTIQPMLNPLINSNAEQHKNPLSTPSTVENTLTKLASLGINTTK